MGPIAAPVSFKVSFFLAHFRFLFDFPPPILRLLILISWQLRFLPYLFGVYYTSSYADELYLGGRASSRDRGGARVEKN